MDFSNNISQKTGVLVLVSLMIIGALGMPSFLLAILPESTSDSSFPGRVGQGTFSITTQAPPVVVGWGGSELQETNPSVSISSNPPSQVFTGEMASDMEIQVRTLSGMGLNTVRVGFESACSNQRELGPYSAATVQRAIDIASHYNFWLILDYHGYSDLEKNRSCWLSFWNGAVSQFKNSYDRIIWEPINEPTGTVSTLSSGYQAWLDQSRMLGDSHWVVVENCLSNGCLSSFTPTAIANGYPTVNDTIGRVFISLHPYYFYDQSYTGIHNAGDPSTWNNSTADQAANVYYQGVLAGMQATGWPALNTEGGAVYFSSNNCSTTTTSCTPPDWVESGDAGYSTTSLRFMQTLTNLFDSKQPQRINWTWWPAGDWTNSPASVPLTEGAITPGSNPPMWGALLYSRPANSTPQNHPPTLQVPGSQNVTAGTTVSFRINASDIDTPPQSLTLFCDNCAGFGATFPNVTGTSPQFRTFTWTPNNSQSGATFSAVFTVTDGQATASASVGITVSQQQSQPPPSQPPPTQPPSQPPSQPPCLTCIPGNWYSAINTGLFWLAAGFVALMLVVLTLTVFRRKGRMLKAGS